MFPGLTIHSFHCASVSLRQIQDQINISGILETLRRTSEDIDDEIVQEVLHKINLQCETRAKLARQILALLAAAKEPMTAEAMCHALGMSFFFETWRYFPSKLDKHFVPDVGVLVKCCEGLIAIDPVSRLVTMVQDDIADCLRRGRSKSLPNSMSSPPPNKDHFSYVEMTMLAAVSVAYLSMSTFKRGPCHRLAALRKRLHKYPFLEYATRHWGYHARELMDHGFTDSATEYAVSKLLRNAKSLESVLQVRDLDADVLRLLKASQEGKGHDQALDSTQIRTGVSALQVLSGSGLTRMVRDLLAQKPASSFEPDSLGTSAIHEAAQAGWDDIVVSLIKAGADPFSMDRNGKSPLDYAARNGCDKVVSVLRGWTIVRDTYYELSLAFFEAIEAGETHVVVRLLEHLGHNTIKERSTILISIRAGHLNILELILDQGADLSCPNLSPSDRIPLHQAIKHGRADMAKLLLDRGADIQTLDDKKRNATFETLKAPNTDGLSLLLDRGIEIDCDDCKGNTVLHQATVDGSDEHVQLLIDQDKIPKNAFNNEGLTPLHLAIRAQHWMLTHMLLECEDIDVNIKATGRAAGRTPLMDAVVGGSLALCELLIQKGAEVNETEGTDLPTVFKLARKRDDKEMRDLRDLLVSARNRSRQVSMIKEEA